MPFRNLLASLFALACLLSTAALTQESPGREMEKERALWEQLRAVSPGAVEPFKGATAALDKGDCQEAARLYEEVVRAAPDFTPALRRRGFCLVQLGRGKEGVALLEKALGLERTPENMWSLAEALAYPGQGVQASRQDKLRAYALAVEADGAQQSPDFSYPALVAQLSLELDKEDGFRAAVRKLNDRHPGLLPTHYYTAIRAAMDEDWAAAESEIRKAEARGLPAEEVQRFLDSGVGTRAAVWRYTYYVLYLAGAWGFGLLLLFVLGKIFSGATMRSIESADPDELTGERHHSLRKYYRALINFAGVYYYVSLPVVICLVVLVAGSIIYAFVLLGRIPIKLVLLLAVGALITVFQMVRSLFVKHEQEDPGRALREEEAPGLWALAREVAGAAGTRPVDEIRVTPGTDLAVYERGTLRERKQDRAARVLIVGVGALNGFSQNSFRAVLAHEYGHFLGRDTAGGDVALRVNNDMVNFAHAMARGGQAVWWNVAFLFLRVYHFLFRRISHGATRLQEMLADRVAVRNYGARAFEEGLSHVVYRAVEFDHLVSNEIGEAVNKRRAVQNLYELPGARGSEIEKTVEEDFNKSLNRQTSEDDTHPSPVERFRLASRVTSKGEPPSAGEVWELFADRAALTREMSELIDTRVREAYGEAALA